MSETQTFTLPASEFDLKLLPEHARVPGTAAFREAVSRFFDTSFLGFAGKASVLVTEEKITVTWSPDSSRETPLQEIVLKLQNGRVTEGIQLLLLLLSRDPDNCDVLYNLGLAESSVGNLELSETHLRRVVELSPRFVDGLVALGTTLSRMHQVAEAMELLETALELEDGNLCAHKNLGVMLLKQGNHDRAVTHLQRAVEIDPDDQGSWLGLGNAFRQGTKMPNAAHAYRRAIAINAHNDFAEAAREGLNALSRAKFENKTADEPRLDAVEYCASAIKLFSSMPLESTKVIAAEISMLGRSGLDVNGTSKRYTLKSLPGDFLGLQLVCYMYVAFQLIAPGTDIGFNLSREYQIARER